jgi:hypothetical protein
MHGPIPPLPQYAFMARCSFKKEHSNFYLQGDNRTVPSHMRFLRICFRRAHFSLHHNLGRISQKVNKSNWYHMCVCVWGGGGFKSLTASMCWCSEYLAFTAKAKWVNKSTENALPVETKLAQYTQRWLNRVSKMEHIRYRKQFLDYRPIGRRLGRPLRRTLEGYNRDAAEGHLLA